MADYLSFALSEEFINKYKTKTPNWGFPVGNGNTLGEITFLTKYSRKKQDGTKEQWWETCQRCIEGYYSILKDHCKKNRTQWNEFKAQKAAQDAFERMFTFKWLPPGRGLWMMGTEFVHVNQNSAALQNCAFVSTEKISTHSLREATLPFVRMMEMSMLGVGVGFDTKGAGNFSLHQPTQDVVVYEIPDTREGWCDSVLKQLETYFFKNRKSIEFDYSKIRKEGEPIKGFGGTSGGPGPLKDLHIAIFKLFENREGEEISSSDIVDLMNLIGKCVVSGNVRRSAQLALGYDDDQDYLNLKNYEINPERMGPNGWGHSSNNSILAKVGTEYDVLGELIATNGEPGLFYLDLCRKYGRMVDAPNNKDHRVMGTNPCSEQSLESFEMCCLVETFPFNHDSLDDYLETLEHAYLYGKAVTLLSTHWPETNEVMQRNRRIGCSMSGIVQFVESKGWSELKNWLDTGYTKVKERDVKYSEWLGVRESIKMTSVKPSGTVSLLAGASPGVHWPVHSTYIRRIRLLSSDPMVKVFEEAGYKVEPDVMDERTVCVEFPTLGVQTRVENDVSVWEKASLAALLQKYWADNQVSVTFSFNAESEKDQIAPLIRSFEGQLKSMSFLPKFMDSTAYAQMPYEEISIDDWLSETSKVKPINFKKLYKDKNSEDALGEKFCSNDTCEIV